MPKTLFERMSEVQSMTDPKLQMARQACASACEDQAWRPDIIAGKCDDWLGVLSALAAIEECTDRIERLDINLPGVGVGLADGAAMAKRQILDHLKGPTA